MWIWEWDSTDGGDADEIVQQAVSAGLHQLWVRVGDSMNGFYGAEELDSLVPVAHAHGLAVIAWGFPYLWDPVGDAQWTAQILDWRAPDGQQVDGYSADIEEATEGVMLSAQRAAVYLELVRQAAGSRLVVATVYPPTDASWDGGYPYQAMAPYVDAFAPMIYWECTDPGTDAALDVARLSTLRPVHVIGQAFNFAGDRRSDRLTERSRDHRVLERQPAGGRDRRVVLGVAGRHAGGVGRRVRLPLELGWDPADAATGQPKEIPTLIAGQGLRLMRCGWFGGSPNAGPATRRVCV